ncbi:MAG: HNH endonuclease [Dehalococcoidia bacterium]|nr:MAG: HNH endonuclease [Dehalococcoidia bacterium]
MKPKHLVLLFVALLIVLAVAALCSRPDSLPERANDHPLTATTETTSRQAATEKPLPRGLHMPPVATPHTGSPKYDRSAWQHWIDEDVDCQDTRQEVLIAESRVPVSFAGDKACRVAAGQWFDEYTGQTFTDPSDVDIDHLVPLENAHKSGGWDWAADRRRAYANDLAHPEALIAVRDSVNQAKGSDGPEAWRPPRREYWCDYATAWVTVKTRWSLTVTVPERDALVTMLAACPAE